MSSFERAGTLVLVMLLLGACSAPPTPQQATSRAVKRNCEARADAAAEELRRQSTADGASASQDIERRVAEVRENEFRACMLESAL